MTTTLTPEHSTAHPAPRRDATTPTAPKTRNASMGTARIMDLAGTYAEAGRAVEAVMAGTNAPVTMPPRAAAWWQPLQLSAKRV